MDDEGKNFPAEIDSLNIDFTTFATYEYITLLEAESEWQFSLRPQNLPKLGAALGEGLWNKR